jgi:hypothetical protein
MSDSSGDVRNTLSRLPRTVDGWVLAMPGWESYSTWGRDEPLGLSEHAYLYAQLYRNSDDPDGAPRVWITPPKYVLATLDQLAEAIATEIAPYEAIPLPPALIRGWMVQ